MKHISAVAGLAFLCASSACGYGDGDDETQSVGAVSRISHYVIDRSESFEDPILAIADQVESFAGYHCEGGDLVVSVDTANNVSEDLIRSLIAAETVSSCWNRFTPDHSPSVRFRTVAFNYLSLRSWQDALVQALTTIPEANGLGISFRGNRLVISAVADAGALVALLDSVGVPSEAREVVVEPRPRQETTCASSSNGPTVRDCFRPTPAGVQIEMTYNGGQSICSSVPPEDPVCGCTIGSANLRWMAEQATPFWKQGYITASHCVPNMSSVGSNWAFQNLSAFGGNFLAVEYVDPPTHTWNGSQWRWSDAAWMWSWNNEAQLGTIARTQWWNGSRTIDTSSPRFYIGGALGLVEGMVVEKVGRTTGWTMGQVTNTCYHVAGLTPKMRCQGLASYSSSGGDSGSPVFYWNVSQGRVYLLGTHWGAGPSVRYFSPWNNIATELGNLYAIYPGF